MLNAAYKRGRRVSTAQRKRYVRQDHQGCPSQHRPDTGNQLARAEGFRQVVVGADFEAEDDEARGWRLCTDPA
jgi:hypothetical protein